MAGNPNWEALSIQIPGEDLLEGARKGMEALMAYLEVVKALLETVKVFLVDFGNPIKPLVEAVLQLVLDLFETLRRTGLYGWFDVPNPLVDPNFNRFVGGFPAFINRFKAGLYDPRDPNRPQPVDGATQGGFLIIVADAEDPLALMRYIETLMRFFGKEFTTPQYQAPANFKVLPVGDAGDPILAVTKIFQFQPDKIAVEWSLPPVTSPGDPGFSDLIQAASMNFVPPRFLIEKSEINPAVGEINISTSDVSQLSDPAAAGPVTMNQQTYFRVRGREELITRKIRLFDQNEDPFLKFQKYLVVDAKTETATFLLGQLGTFRYIDTEVEQNKTYYYRVRAFSGSLAVSGTSVSFKAPQTNVIDQNPYLEWPAQDSSNPPVMGKASPIAQIMIPTYPEKFDVIENLRRLFQTAFSLNFHLPLPSPVPEGTFIDGVAVDPTDIGKNSLTALAGPLLSFEAVPLVGDSVSSVAAVTAKFQPDPATGLLPENPWNDSRVVYNASRLSIIVSGAMLTANAAVAFKTLMEGPFPKGIPQVEGLNAKNISEMVFRITEVQHPQTDGVEALQRAAELYGKVFDDREVRLNVLAAVKFCTAFTLVGAPPDWIQISLLRDIAPWSGQIIYELLAKMQALLDAYAGVISELKVFIDLIVQKIDTLERFLEYLVSILDFVEGLSLGFYILMVPETSGGVGEWISLIDNAGGTPPPSGPGGYTGGVSIAYVAPDVKPYADALKLIF